ncbi:MAG: GNAT family N-acetyltransferase [Clostridiaceae bacterium]|nr:GNAT family N-acetyltransferase [Clostridiaceae bacterium]
MDIEFAKQTDKQELLRLYDICFPGEHDYGEYFHNNFWRPEKTLVIRDNGGIISMVNLLDVRFNAGDEEIEASYIYAAATDPAHRGKGLMQKLLEASFELGDKWGKDLSVLITENDSLFAFYKKFGYEPSFGVSLISPNDVLPGFMCKVRMLDSIDCEMMEAVYNTASLGRLAVARDIDRFVSIIEEYKEHAFGLFDQAGNMMAYCLMDESNEEAREVMGIGMEYLLYTCCMDMKTGFGKSLPSGEGDVPIGCAKALTEKGRQMLLSFSLPPYMNILFN